MALEQSDGLERWLEILAQLEKPRTWRRAVLLALVRSELSIKILVMASAALLENDAALFSDLARYVLAVEFEFAVDRMRARGHQLEGSLQPGRCRGTARALIWLHGFF